MCGWAHTDMSSLHVMSACVVVFRRVCVWVQPSSRLTCAAQPQGPERFCSLSTNLNKAQTAPQWGMSHCWSQTWRVDQNEWVFVCVLKRHKDQLSAFSPLIFVDVWKCFTCRKFRISLCTVLRCRSLTNLFFFLFYPHVYLPTMFKNTAMMN